LQITNNLKSTTLAAFLEDDPRDSVQVDEADPVNEEEFFPASTDNSVNLNFIQ